MLAADVAGDLRELLGRDEDLVAVAVLELEVVAGDPGDGPGVEAGEAGDAVVLVDDVLAGGEVAERGEPAAGRRRRRGAAAVDETPERHDREPERRGDEAVGDARLREEDRGIGRRRTVAEHLRGQSLERVAGALRLADSLEGDDRRVAGARLLLELRLGLGEAARGRDGDRAAEGLAAVGDVGIAVADAGHREDRARPERVADRHVEAGDVVVVDRRADVGEVVVEGGVELVGSGDDDRGPIVDQLEERPEAIGRQELGERPLRPLLGSVGERRLGEQPVVGIDLGGRGQLDPLGLAERALRERREVADRLDLVAEQLDPRRLILGRGEDVEDPAADRELAAVVDLLDPLVAAAGEQLGDVAEVDLLAPREREAGRPQRRVGDRLGERHGAGDDDRRLLVAIADEGVEGGDPEADEVWRRRQVRLVAGPPGRVVADAARRQVGAELAGEVTGAAIVGGDDEQRPPGEAGLRLGQRGEQIRAQPGGDRDRGPFAVAGGVDAGGERREGRRRLRLPRGGNGAPPFLSPGSRARVPPTARRPGPRLRPASAPRPRPRRAAST